MTFFRVINGFHSGNDIPFVVRLAGLMLLFAIGGFAAVSDAQVFPTKPLRLIIPFAPGGGTDFIGRLVAIRLAEPLGQQVIVDNRPGASGNLGTELGIKAPADGYTLTLVSSGYTVNAALSPLKFDPVKDVSPVVLLDRGPLVIVVHPSLPVKTVGDLIGLARVKPGAINYASSGQGSILHMATELFLSMTNTKMTNVPYKGTGPAITDTIAGQTHVLFGVITATIPYTRSGRLRAIAVTSAERSSIASEIPTLSEAGVKGYDVTNWHGVIGPKGLPSALVDRLNREMVTILKQKDTEEKLQREGVTAIGGTAESFLLQISREIEMWRGVVAKTGIKGEF